MLHAFHYTDGDRLQRCVCKTSMLSVFIRILFKVYRSSPSSNELENDRRKRVDIPRDAIKRDNVEMDADARERAHFAKKLSITVAVPDVDLIRSCLSATSFWIVSPNCSLIADPLNTSPYPPFPRLFSSLILSIVYMVTLCGISSELPLVRSERYSRNIASCSDDGWFSFFSSTTFFFSRFQRSIYLLFLAWAPEHGPLPFEALFDEVDRCTDSKKDAKDKSEEL